MLKRFKKLLCYIFGHKPADNNVFPDVRCLRCGGWYLRNDSKVVTYL